MDRDGPSSQESPASGETPKALGSRWSRLPRVVRGGIYALVAAGGIGGTGLAVKPLPRNAFDETLYKETGLTFSREVQRLAHMKEKREMMITQLRAEYEQTGNPGDPAVLVDTLILQEWSEYVEREKDEDVLTTDGFRERHLQKYMADIDDGMQQLDKQKDLPTDLDPAVLEAAKLKTAMDFALPKAVYNKDYNGIPEIFTKGKLQCESGTKLYLLTAQQALTDRLQKSGGQLVVIYTSGHMLAGIVTAKGELHGIEMTARGPAVKDFGPLKTLKEPLGVCKADHALVRMITGAEEHKDKAFLFDNRPKKKMEAAQGNEKPRHTSRNPDTFGKVDVPEGDLKMSKQGVVAVPVQQKEPDEGLEFGRRDPEAPKQGDKNAYRKNLKPEELKIVEAYDPHGEYLRHSYNANVLIMRIIQDPETTEDEYKEMEAKLKALAQEVRAYIDARDGLEKLAIESKIILKRYGRDLQVMPEHIYGILQTNIRNMPEFRRQALLERKKK